jgi:hypothetical protein
VVTWRINDEVRKTTEQAVMAQTWNVQINYDGGTDENLGNFVWIGLAQGRDKWGALVNAVLNIRVP